MHLPAFSSALYLSDGGMCRSDIPSGGMPPEIISTPQDKWMP